MAWKHGNTYLISSSCCFAFQLGEIFPLLLQLAKDTLHDRFDQLWTALMGTQIALKVPQRSDLSFQGVCDPVKLIAEGTNFCIHCDAC